MPEIEYSTFRSCGRTLSVGVVGKGPPLLLVPGTLQSADRWIDAGYVDALARQHRLLLLDPLGHGKSERSTQPEDYAQARLIDHLADALRRRTGCCLGLQQRSADGRSACSLPA